MKCDKCSSTNIIYYKQLRKDGRYIVTARCENDHLPETGKPFYPSRKFDIMKLPLLGEENIQIVEIVKNKPKRIKKVPAYTNLEEYLIWKQNLKFP